MVKEYSLLKDGNKKISDHFAIKEFKCKDGSDKILIDDNLPIYLEKIRTRFGKPVIINSAYRTEEYNTKVGGAKSSYHVKGMAADIRINGVNPLEVARYAQDLGMNGVGCYSSFTHVDTRPAEKKYYWDLRSGKELRVTQF